MANANTIEAPTFSKDTLNRLAELRRERRRITHEIKEIIAILSQDIVARPTVSCLRCGFTWTPHNPLVRPRACARCVTTAWDKPPTATSRRPSDPPSPSWRVRSMTARRRPRMQPEPKRILHRRTKEEIALDMEKAATVATKVFAPVPPAPVPPRISALLPPPPTPSSSHVPSQTLSAWLRDVAVEDGKSEPQPERVSSHAISLPPPPEIIDDGVLSTPEETSEVVLSAPPETPPVENPVETVEIIPAPAGAEEQVSSRVDRPEAPLPIEVPPESVGLPVTDAEREELARAKEEVWPTTRGDE